MLRLGSCARTVFNSVRYIVCPMTIPGMMSTGHCAGSGGEPPGPCAAPGCPGAGFSPRSPGVVPVTQTELRAWVLPVELEALEAQEHVACGDEALDGDVREHGEVQGLVVAR